MGPEPVRKLLAIFLYSLAGLGGLLCVLALLAVWASIDRNAASGDLAGASLLISFILVALLPFALVALISAMWLAPPRRDRGQGGRRESAQEPAAETRAPVSKPRSRLAAGALTAAAALVLAVALGLANALGAAHRHNGTHGRELVRLALLDLLVLSPVLLLAVVLSLVGGAILRRRPGPQ